MYEKKLKDYLNESTSPQVLTEEQVVILESEIVAAMTAAAILQEGAFDTITKGVKDTIDAVQLEIDKLSPNRRRTLDLIMSDSKVQEFFRKRPKNQPLSKKEFMSLANIVRDTFGIREKDELFSAVESLTRWYKGYSAALPA